MQSLFKLPLFLVLLVLTNKLHSQQALRIIITPKDSVYKWDNGESSGSIREFSINEGTVIDFESGSKILTSIKPVAGRGNNIGPVVAFHSNGIIMHQGKLGYTTNVDSLKDKSRDGYMDYVGKVGWWHYYSDKGYLLKKERWSKGRLIETIHFKTSVKP